LTVTNSLVLFALTLLLGRTIWGLALNITTIEGWEIERHETLLRRARTLGGSLDGPDGTKIRIQHQEFPWDIGIWRNLCQTMGTWNPIAWFWPLAFSPKPESGLVFEHNEIEGMSKYPSTYRMCYANQYPIDPSKPWPPPDPDRMYRTPRASLAGDGFTQSMDIEAFRMRQEADLQRYSDGERVVRRRPFHERYEHLANASTSDGVYGEAEDTASEDDEEDEEEPLRSRAAERAGDEGEEA